LIPVKYNLVGIQHSVTIEKIVYRKGDEVQAPDTFFLWRSSKRYYEMNASAPYLEESLIHYPCM